MKQRAMTLTKINHLRFVRSKINLLELIKKRLYWELKGPQCISLINALTLIFLIAASISIFLVLTQNKFFLSALIFILLVIICDITKGVITYHIANLTVNLSMTYVVTDWLDDDLTELTWITGTRDVQTNSHTCHQPWLEHYLYDEELYLAKCKLKGPFSQEKALQIRDLVEEKIDSTIESEYDVRHELMANRDKAVVKKIV